MSCTHPHLRLGQVKRPVSDPLLPHDIKLAAHCGVSTPAAELNKGPVPHLPCTFVKQRVAGPYLHPGGAGNAILDVSKASVLVRRNTQWAVNMMLIAQSMLPITTRPMISAF